MKNRLISLIVATAIGAFSNTLAWSQNISPAMAAALRDQLQQQVKDSIATATEQTTNATNSQGADGATSAADARLAPTKQNTGDVAREAPEGFQKFVFEATGKKLPYFGQDALSTGERVWQMTQPVSQDYEVVPGDQIHVNAWGGIDVRFAGKVDRDGQLSIPKIGTFPVAGIRARELDGYLKQQIGRFYKNFQVSVTLGRLGGISVFVSGHAEQPGMHVVPSTSTLATIAFGVARPTENGSYRKISLKRGNQIVGSFDLYELISRGTLSSDVRLRSGDIIQIHPAGIRVALNVDSPAAAIFELTPEETIDDLLSLSGLNRNMIRQEFVLIESINSTNPNAPRTVEQLSYQRGLSSRLQDGAIVTLFPILSEFANAVTLKGNVSNPARYPHFPGMRVSDLITDQEMLIPPSYYEQRNALAAKQTFDRQMDATQRLKERFSEPAISQERKSATSNLEQNTLNVEYKIEKDQEKITVEDTVKNLLPEINWDYAVIERLEKTELKSKLIPFSLRKALANDPRENLQLIPGDVVTIFSADDTNIPKSRKTALIKVSGEVGAPGYYQISNGETIRDILVRAGGLTQDSFLFGLKLTRRSIHEQQKEQLKKALDQAERMVQAAEVSRTSGALNSSDAANARSLASSQRAYIDRLRQVNPDGRLVLDILPNAVSIAEIPPLTLEDGDEIAIPPAPGQVAVFGSVYSQGAFAFQTGRSVYDYLDEAGGAAKTSDDSSIFVIRANGKVRSAQQGWIPFVSGLAGEAALPGDAIYVPEDYERVSILKSLLDVSTVFYQLGLGVAAIDAIRD